MGDFIRQKRLKIFHVDERALLGFLNCHKGSEFLTLPTGPQIPEGCEIVRVWHDNYSRSLCVMLAHDSFPEVPDGADAPRADFFIELEALERIPVADKFMEAGFSVVYYPDDPTGVAFKRAKEICKTIGGWSWPQYRQLSPPVGFKSEFPPPPITSLERWLIVANKEKYTVGEPREKLLSAASAKFCPLQPVDLRETSEIIRDYDRQLIDKVIQGMGIPAEIVNSPQNGVGWGLR